MEIIVAGLSDGRKDFSRVAVSDTLKALLKEKLMDFAKDKHLV